MAVGKCFPYRPHDYMYDPVFTVSGPTDHYKAAFVAKMSTAKFQICPIFPNMFSDLPNHPRIQVVQRRTPTVSTFRERKAAQYDPVLRKNVDVLGKDRLKFFFPVVNFPNKDTLPYMYSPTFTLERVDKKQKIMSEGKKSCDKEIETKFRESCAQTEPWQPPFKIIGKGDPEILKLEFLKWGSGLPAGINEVRLIERARMKAAWEKVIQPNIQDPSSLVQFRDYLEALERDEWAFREQEIQEIQELRLQLLENMLNEIHEMSRARAESKMRYFIEKKESEKKEKLEQIRKKTSREVRKLVQQRKGLKQKYHEVNIIDEHTDKQSEIYAPLIRHGEHPKRWHKVIDDKLKKYQAQFIGVEHFSTLPTWLDQATKVGKRELYEKPPRTGLCTKETKWTAPILKQLHEELINLHKDEEKRPLNLRTVVEVVEHESFTPDVGAVPPDQENRYQAVVLLQKIIRGRAEQMLIYEGRNTCKELIQELKYTVGLLKKQKEMRTKEKLKVRQQQREECIQLNMVHRLQGMLGRLQGSIVGTLLDFLNKELKRLLEERKAHAMCLLNERERYIREAAEAGRRQKELRRRREHDEIFKQIVKITQESVDIYLQDIITDGMEFASKEEATNYVLKLVEKVDKETDEAYQKCAEITIGEQDGMIADMVHHFMLPDVEKKLVREKIQIKQKEKLMTIHELIYSNFDQIPLPDSTNSDEFIRGIVQEIEEKAIVKYDDIPPQKRFPEQQEYLTECDDPVEKYLAQLIEDHDEDIMGSYSGIAVTEDVDLRFRGNVLDTITEVDSESSSKKE